MNRSTKTSVFGALLLFGAAGCADLEVNNPNDPDRGGALANANDVESLVIGSYNSQWHGEHDNDQLPISVMSFQTSAPWANFGMHKYSLFPRATLINSPADQDYGLINYPWSQNYKAIASVAAGLSGIEGDVAEELGEERVARAQAFGNLVLGLAHGSIAILFDRGFVVDETTDLTAEQEAVPAEQVLAASIGYFQKAIDIANSGAFESIPASWMNTPDDLTPEEFVRFAHSQRAAYRASLPRTAAEKSMVDWNAVLADLAAGVQEDFIQDQSYYEGWYNDFKDWGSWESWQQLPYFIYGFADSQSDNYETWLNTPIADRKPIIDGEDILIVTPDLRFPRGSTLAEQIENPGTLIEINVFRNSSWAQAARGTWRWSYYRSYEWDYFNSWSSFLTPEIEKEEVDLLAAEAHYWLGDLETAAQLINQTRVAAGLNPTNAAGLNTSCVPKLPNGECGDLLEMLKWEKRMETFMSGMAYGNSWYFDSRRWDDLYLGTALEFPIPAGELQTLLMPLYTTGGVGGTSASDGSTYAWPGEN